MNNPGFSIQWVPVDNASGVERIITSEQIITMNDDEDDPANSSSTSNHNFLEISSIPNTLDQIAAENLIFMAQDGQVLDGQIVANLVDNLIEEDENDILDGDQDSKRSINSSENDMQNNQQYFECQVTEEIITDDWAQQGQGEDRLEIPVEQIVVDQSIEDIDVPLPTDQDEYTALRPYPCDFCSRRFRKKSSLLAHMINHQNDRPHICNLCGARFVRRTELLNHLKSHANEEQQFLQRQQQQQFEEIDENYKFLNTSGTGDHYYEHDWQESYEPSPTPKKPKTKSIRNPVGRPRKHPMKVKAEKIDEEFILPESSIQNNVVFEITDPRKPFICQECGVAFAREKALLAHSKIHGNDSPFECNSCNEMFWDLNALTEHHRNHHFEASNSEYEPTEDSDNSDENESKYGEYYCNLCGMSFHRQDLLKRHTKQHLKKELVEDSTAAILDTTGRHCCNVCGENFDEALDLLAHAEVHARVQSNNDGFRCLLCGESFLEEATIKKHLTGAHADEMTPNSCILCGKHCRDRKALIKHSWDHSHEKSHSCSSCGKTFHNKARLKRHMVSHRSKAVTCEVCHEEFPDGRTLMNHRHSHSNAGGKMFPCHECGKSFGSRSSQQIHVRIHTGERPYGCRFCWKAFADGGTLRKHERIHTGEKPYACSVCPRAFNQRVVLREHIRSHHSSIDSKRGTYYCTVCSAELPSSTELIKHLIQHSDFNTQLQRQPVTAPRKYKRRRKLKPHELERLKTERGNTSDVDMSDEFTDNIVEDLFSEKTKTTAKSKGKKSNNAKTTRNVKSEKLNNKKADPVALSNHWETKLITNSSPNESYNLSENTLQSIDPLIINATGSSSTKSTKRSGRGGPKMIHTQKTRVPIEDSNSKRKTKTVITRAETANLPQQSKHSVQEITQDLHDLQSQSLQLPLFGRRKRDFSTSDFDSVLPDEITSSPQKVNEPKTDMYVDAQLLLETSAIRKELDKYNYNSNIVSDLEDILHSPERQLTYDSEINNQLSSPEKRSTRRSVPNRKYLEFDTTAGQKLTHKEKSSPVRYSTRNKRKIQEELITPDIFNKSSDTDIKIESDSSDDENRINIKNESIEVTDEVLSDELSTYKKSKENFQCEMCSEIFIDRAQLLAHVNIHI